MLVFKKLMMSFILLQTFWISQAFGSHQISYENNNMIISSCDCEGCDCNSDCEEGNCPS